MPSRITGAEKFMFGIFAGGWKFGGNPPGRPGCWLVCIPGGGLTPGADIPGGPVTNQTMLIKAPKQYEYPERAPYLEAHSVPESPVLGAC